MGTATTPPTNSDFWDLSEGETGLRKSDVFVGNTPNTATAGFDSEPRKTVWVAGGKRCILRKKKVYSTQFYIEYRDFTLKN